MANNDFCIHYILKNIATYPNRESNVETMNLLGSILSESQIADLWIKDNGIYFSDANVIIIEQNNNQAKNFIKRKVNDTGKNQNIRRIIKDKILSSIHKLDNAININSLYDSVENKLDSTKLKNLKLIKDSFESAYKNKYPDLIDFINSLTSTSQVISWLLIFACFPEIEKKGKSDHFIGLYSELITSSLAKINTVYDDTNIYKEKYKEPFLLHKRDGLISFSKGVYISPECEIKEYTDRDEKEPNKVYSAELMDEMIKQLSNMDNPSNLFLLYGHGASGKTSFVSVTVSELSTLYKEKIDLYVIMLRRFSDTPADKLVEKICANIPEMSDNSIVILDGLDELYMMQRNNSMVVATEIVNKLCTKILTCHRKILITSRPGVASADEVWSEVKNNPRIFGMTVATINPFNHNKRREFISKLQQADRTLINNKECLWITELSDNNEVNNLLSFPFFIYLIAASSKANSVAQHPITDFERTNIWALFHRLFHDIYFDSNYWDSGTDMPTREVIRKQKERLYTISCYVTWKMCSGKLGKYYCTSEEIKDIISELNYEPKLIKEIEYYYPISSYINKLGENNAYEFSHNYLRDYFLCEFFLSNMNDLIANGADIDNIILWIKKYMYPHNLINTALGVQEQGGNIVLKLIQSFRDYYHISGENPCYTHLLKFSLKNWQKLIYILYHELENGTLSGLGTEKNLNVYLNVKHIFYRLATSLNLEKYLIQDYNWDNNTELIDSLKLLDRMSFGLGDWIVVAIDEEYISLISAIGFIKPFHEVPLDTYSVNNIKYENSTIRSWLNHSFFYNWFVTPERRTISYLKKDSDPVQLPNYEILSVLGNKIYDIVNETRQLYECLNISNIHNSAWLNILSSTETYRAYSSKWDNYYIQEYPHMNKNCLVFPVIKISKKVYKSSIFNIN